MSTIDEPRVEPPAGAMRVKVARGTVVNALFLAFVNVLQIARGIFVVALITASDYGIWGILSVTIGLLLALRQTAVSDRFVQQRQADQVEAFHQALGMELLTAAALTLAACVLVPVVAFAYSEQQIIVPGLVFAAVFAAMALQAPLAVFYREMDFAKQRRLQAIDPVVGLLVTLGLAEGGAGYWALIAGAVIGPWCAALAALRACPYPLGVSLDRATIRSYLTFSWPIVLFGLSGMLMGQAVLLVGKATAGLATVGFITLSYTISQFAFKLDQAIASTIYPAICAAQDRPALLRETLIKSNRLALMWAVPFGMGLVLFVPVIVPQWLGHEWKHAVPLLQSVGILAMLNQIVFNWDSFYRAAGNTRPIAVAAVIGIALYCGLCLPGLIIWGVDGLAWAFVALAVLSLPVRAVFVARLFPGLRIWGHALRSLAPVVPAGLAVLGLRALLHGGHVALIAELLVYGVLCVGITIALERTLLREMYGYLRGGRGVAAEAPA